jgi:hypothetical protein
MDAMTGFGVVAAGGVAAEAEAEGEGRGAISGAGGATTAADGVAAGTGMESTTIAALGEAAAAGVARIAARTATTALPARTSNPPMARGHRAPARFLVGDEALRSETAAAEPSVVVGPAGAPGAVTAEATTGGAATVGAMAVSEVQRRSSANGESAAESSATVAKRSPGVLARQRMTTASKPGGSDGTCVWSGGTVFVKTFSKSSPSDEASMGGRPATSW